MRETFAFGAGQPVQGSASLSGQSRGGFLEGGQNQGGVVTARPTTFADPNDPTIPQFLQAAMEPYIKRKQQESMYRGMDDRASGKALDQIAKSDSGVMSIFGPSYYHQGAALYQATGSVDDVNQSLLDDPDLYKLGEADRSAEISRRYASVLTGDPTADTIIHQKTLETRNSIVNTLAKRNAEYVQTEARQRLAGATDKSAGVWQSIASAQSELSSPTDQDKSALYNAQGNFLSSLQKPLGMRDNTYQKFLSDAARNMIAQGNLYAFNSLKGAGLLKSGGPLTDDQIAGLETAHDRAASRAMGDFAAFDPKFIAMKAGLHADIAAGRIKAPIEASKRLDEINSYVMGKTGSDVPMFDAGAVTSVADAVTDSAVAAARRAEERQWQLEDRQAGWDHEAKVKADEQSARIAQAGSFWGQGDVSLGLATGVMKSEDANLFATKSWTGGDMGSLARAFVGTKAGGGYVSDPVAKMAQSQIEAAGGKYTPDFDTGYRKWKALDQANPGAAAAYYGKYAVMLKRYDGLLAEHITPALAYERAFSDPAQYDIAGIPADQRKQFDGAIANSIDNLQTRAFHPGTWGSWSLAASSRNTIRAAISAPAAQYLAHTGLTPDAAVGATLPAMRASGEVEILGRLAWRNERGTKPIAQSIGQPEDVTANVLMKVVGKRLEDAGFKEGINGDDYTVHRLPTAGDPVSLYVMAMEPDGSGAKEVLITRQDLINEVNGEAREKLERSQPKPVFPTINVSSDAIAARRQSDRDAMKGNGKPIDLTPFVNKGASTVSNAAISLGSVLADPDRAAKDAGAAGVDYLRWRFDETSGRHKPRERK